MVVGILYTFLKTRKVSAVTGPLKAIDFETIGLLFGLFLVIGGISNMGVIDAVADLIARVSGGNLFLIYTVIVWASVLFSAFIDNIPYVATMLPVVTGLAATLGGDPTVLYFGLLSGATRRTPAAAWAFCGSWTGRKFWAIFLLTFPSIPIRISIVRLDPENRILVRRTVYRNTQKAAGTPPRIAVRGGMPCSPGRRRDRVRPVIVMITGRAFFMTEFLAKRGRKVIPCVPQLFSRRQRQ